MNTSLAISTMYAFWGEWIGPNTPHTLLSAEAADRIHTSMKQEYDFRKGKPQFAGVSREIKGKLILLGKARKCLAI